MKALLDVRDLRLSFLQDGIAAPCLHGVSLRIFPGETVGLLGGSGCGKSITAQAIMGLLPNASTAVSGEIWLDDEELLAKHEKELRSVRGKKIGMVFQNPMTSLNPTRTIGSQIIEGILNHYQITRAEAKVRAMDLLCRVGMPDPQKRYDQYPYQFSGGMRQRVLIAMALACGPALLIADEPTTALDVTIQAQLLNLLKTVQNENGTSILLITHDLGVVAGICDRVCIMHSGRIVEQGTADDIFYHPRHPYTRALIEAHPYFAQRASGLIGT